MQQAIYNNISGIAIQTTKTSKTTVASGRRTSVVRRIAQKWDLVGVLALMASSAAYGVYALAHVV